MHVAFETLQEATALRVGKLVANFVAGQHCKKTEVMGPFVLNDGEAPPVLAYCDGGCSHKAGGWGYRIELADGTVAEACGGHPDTTNNRMELTALIRCVEALPIGGRCIVYTDSKYVQQGWTMWLPRWLQRSWRTADDQPVKNVEHWKQLIIAMGEKPAVELRWVKGHSGIQGNERVDVLAGQGMAPYLAKSVIEKETV
jgi:ribonuclease HI